jgi:hypothetical protein
VTDFAAGPTVVRIQYTSAFGFHTMQICTRLWSPPTSGEPLGTVPSWIDDTQIDLFDMVSGFVDLLLPFYPVTASFNNATVFTQADETANFIPQISSELTAKIGTAVAPFWTKAVQATISLRDTETNAVKYVLLDSASFGEFDAIRNLATVDAVFDIVDYVRSTANAFSSQAGLRPFTFLGYFRTLNEKLRKSYRMT